MDEKTIDGLAAVLDQSENQYHELLGLLKKEKEAAMGSDVDLLVEVVGRKTETLARLASLETQRGRLMQTIAERLDVPAGQLTLSRLCLSLSHERAAKFNLLRSSLVRLTEKIKRVNLENRYLIEHCLDLVRGALGFFHQMINPASVYGANGQVHKDTGSGSFLSGNI